MAAYPFTVYGKESRAESMDGRELVRATNGALKTRILYSSDKKRFDLVHRLTSAEGTSLANFYGTNRGTSFTLVWNGGTSTCVFGSPPQFQLLPGGLYSVQVSAEEV